jgi:Flp pilus assembly protein TadD
MNQQEKSLKDLEQAVSLEYEDPEILLLLGTMKEKAGDYEAAVNLFGRLVSLSPDDPTSHYNLGVALGKKGLFSESVKELTRAIELDPKYRQALLARAIAYDFIGDRARSRADFTVALDLQDKPAKDRSLREPVSTGQIRAMLNRP